ncbi:hypothetical protein D2E26_0794 [Bifidobacterium dolichotidis]|uniref:GPI inositol-deacylase PGAP1-like alpha/beta domain-containing protein n=1 Tax=Bifidobacterium dolichotidis TaxID=2306976 RepID=A0A430FPH4_9BIFI|nr:alpha/beta fold hydrolase [Bifidobacterium dolichotidis]RSX54740.1 hypothetical protein D2E26_0794 [Bifidobacterium dolichotidis]
MQIQSSVSDSRQVCVQSRVYGGVTRTAEHHEAQRVVNGLQQARSSLNQVATACSNLALHTSGAAQQLQWCAQPHEPFVTTTSLLAQANDAAARVQRIAVQCENLATLLSHAYNLYADAESSARRAGITALQVMTSVSPPLAAVALGASAAGGMAYGFAKEHKFSVMHTVNGTTWMQEGMLRGLGPWIMAGTAVLNPTKTLHVARDTSSTVEHGAAGLAWAWQPLHNWMQGSDVEVRQVGQHVQAVGEVSSVGGALTDLRQLGETRTQGLRSGTADELSYATIAISQYKRADGSTAWLVTIPGTDGESDSPFAWPQNVELMSDDAEHRMQAESARMVEQAMREAGIQPNDPVALVGHSQGGIVAATIASDCTDEFSIEHIVTAGSPIAQHPVGNQTWVTAIEMDDEVVAALDGAANPTNEQWLTVRGSLNEQRTTSTDDPGVDMPYADVSCADIPYADDPCAGVPVDRDPNTYEITHWLKYHEAAYEHASALGSPELQAHEQHFQQTIQGEYQGTTYWQGRVQK